MAEIGPSRKVAISSRRHRTWGRRSHMFWWFEREGQHLRVEVLQLAADKYELRVTNADETEHVETFGNANDLAKRQQQFQAALSLDGWTGPHGWVI